MRSAHARLRMPISRYGPLGVAAAFLLVILELIIRGGPEPVYSVLAFGGYLLAMGVYEFRRTRLVIYLVLGILWGTGCWHSMVRFLPLPPLSGMTYLIHAILGFGALALGWPVLHRNARLEKNARRLFWLAAERVQAADGTFTDRPFVAGTAPGTRDEIEGLARLLGARNVAVPIFQDGSIFLTFSMGISPLARPGRIETSYVAFSPEGSVMVHITPFDYHGYREELTFDRLCASMGDVFKRFLQHYQQGLDSRILDEIQSVR